MSDFQKADEDILYILVNEEYYPIACLVSNGFEESSNEIETTTRDNHGWETSRPTNQKYSISFEGIETVQEEITGKVTYKDLQDLKKSKTLVSYRIGESTGKRTVGQGYIINLSKDSPASDLVTFSGTLRGFGEYDSFDPALNNTLNYELNFYL
jgi:hypothetical protein